jgi:hypothetical protein
VAGALLCFIAANPAGIAFDSFARRVVHFGEANDRKVGSPVPRFVP